MPREAALSRLDLSARVLAECNALLQVASPDQRSPPTPIRPLDSAGSQTVWGVASARAFMVAAAWTVPLPRWSQTTPCRHYAELPSEIYRLAPIRQTGSR
jgi:hypothetical protein